MPMVQVGRMGMGMLEICVLMGMRMRPFTEFFPRNVFMLMMDIRVGVIMGMDDRFMKMCMLMML